MRYVTLLLMCLATLGVGFAQAYKPRAGETVLQVAIQGRGDVFILLHTEKAPKTTARIAELARQGFYNGQKFFRVEKSPKPFLIQAGDPDSRTKPIGDPSLGTGGTGVKVPYENSGFQNIEGAVGLSTLPRNRDSGDCQFYILLGPARFLDGNYTVFGQVAAGMDVVKKVELGDTISSITVLRG